MTTQAPITLKVLITSISGSDQGRPLEEVKTCTTLTFEARCLGNPPTSDPLVDGLGNINQTIQAWLCKQINHRLIDPYGREHAACPHPCRVVSCAIVEGHYAGFYAQLTYPHLPSLRADMEAFREQAYQEYLQHWQLAKDTSSPTLPA